MCEPNIGKPLDPKAAYTTELGQPLLEMVNIKIILFILDLWDV